MIADIIAILLTLGGALFALASKHMMRAVVGLTVFFVGVAVFFASMGAWYLAVGQLFLFVGGVVTLFVLAFNIVNVPSSAGVRIGGLAVYVFVLAGLSMFVPPLVDGVQVVSLRQSASLGGA